MNNFRYASILNIAGNCSDRFLASGYKDMISEKEMYERIKKIKYIKGIELVSNWHISDKNTGFVKKYLNETGLELVSIIPDHFGDKIWGKGAFCSRDKRIRAKAVKDTKELMDIAAELKCSTISIWPGQDGYDYLFQSDYIREYEWLEDGIRECCQYRNDIKISLEYKLKEPRTHSYISDISKTLLVISSISEKNCGVTIDFGHALVSYENVAESVAIAKKYGNKLFHVHLNDNYRSWDDDLIVGSVHTLEYIEFLYWLKRTGYKGWLSLDQYPYREDGIKAGNESMEWLRIFDELASKISDEEADFLFSRGDACKANNYLRNLLFSKKMK